MFSIERHAFELDNRAALQVTWPDFRGRASLPGAACATRGSG